MNRFAAMVAAVGAALAATTAAAAAPAPPQGTQSNTTFADSYAAKAVVNVSATTERVSCYAPEVPYPTALTAADGYPGGGETADVDGDHGATLGPRSLTCHGQ